MFKRSYTTLNDLLIYGMAAELVRIQDEWHDFALHAPGDPAPGELVERFKASNDLLLDELLRRLALNRGQTPPFRSRLVVCQGIRIYLMFHEFRWTYHISVFSDGVRQLMDEENRSNRYFLCKDAQLLCAEYEEGMPSGRCLMQLRDGRFLDCYWDVAPTLKMALDHPYEKFRELAPDRVLRWLHRHDHRDEFRLNYPAIYAELGSERLNEHKVESHG